MKLNDTRTPGTQTATTVRPTAHIPAISLDPLLKDRECAAMLGVSVPTFWRRVADGTVPKPIKLGALSRWPQSEVLEVIERAKAARETAA